MSPRSVSLTYAPRYGKGTGEIMTLRGGFDMAVGRSSHYGASTEHQIFEYEAPARTQGWRVIRAFAWIQGALTGTAGGDSRMLAQFTLSTDTLGDVTITDGATAREWEQRIGTTDNRTIGWLSTDYQNRDNVSADFITPGMGFGNELLMDADRLITNELWMQTFAVTEASDYTAHVNYYIELEKVKVSHSESLIQQIKGMGQSIQ